MCRVNVWGLALILNNSCKCFSCAGWVFVHAVGMEEGGVEEGGGRLDEEDVGETDKGGWGRMDV